MISKATKNEILEREEKNRLKAEKHKTDLPLKAKSTIRCIDSIKPEDRIAMSWSLAIEGKKLGTSLCSWVALTLELIARDIIFHTYDEPNKKKLSIRRKLQRSCYRITKTASMVL